MSATVHSSHGYWHIECPTHELVEPAESRRDAEERANTHNLVHHLPAWIHA